MTTTAPAVSRRPLTTRTATAAITLMFAVNGMILGGYGGGLPALREKLAISDTQIAVMLFCGGVAGILSMQIGGRLADAIGARRVALAVLPVLVVAAATIGLAPSYPVAVLGAVLIGLGNGAMDVAMNAIAVQIETARRRPVMSSFHAFFSIGNFVGAGTVLLMSRALGLSGGAIVTPLLLTLAVVAVAAALVLVRITPDAAVVAHRVDGVRTRIPRAAWILGAMALAFGLSEGTAVDWSSLHVTDVARVDSTTGSLGLIAVSGFMVVIRLLGDRLVTRFGRRTVVRFGAICAALGYLSVTLVSTLPLLVLGWCLVGFGVGMIAPQVYAVAGHIGGGRVLAVVVTFGYAAFLMGPAVMGFLIRHLGIHHAMAVPAVLCAGIVALAATMPKNDPAVAGHCRASRLGGPGRPERRSPRRTGVSTSRLSTPRVSPVTDQDEVDHLVDAWSRERPDLDVTPMQVLSRVTRLARHLDRQRAASFARHGLESWEFDVLAALRRAGDPFRLSPGQLLTETMVTSGTMTNRVDRLTGRGLVAREHHPDDRRGVRVRLTANGLAQVDAALADLLEAERVLLRGLNAADQQTLAQTLRGLLLPYVQT